MRKYNILISTSSFSIPDEEISRILGDHANIIKNPYGRRLTDIELLELGNDASAIIAGTEPYNHFTIPNLKKLKIISRIGVGIDNVDTDLLSSSGIELKWSTVDISSTVAEHSIGLILSALRNIPTATHDLSKGVWKRPVVRALNGKTVGILGLGVIGKKLVQLLQGFGVKIMAYDHYPDKELCKRYSIDMVTRDTLFKESDILSIHLNLTDDTFHMIDKEAFSKMKDSIIIVNVSRGGIVNEVDLLNFLKKNKRAIACLDVFEEEPYQGPLTNQENAILTPHIAGYAREDRHKMELEALSNIKNSINV